MVTSPRKDHFYGDQSQKRSFLWGMVPEKVTFIGTGPRKCHFYGDQFLEKVSFIVTSPRKGHFYGDQSQKTSNNYWPEKIIINYFYGPVLFLWDRSWGT